VKSPAGAQYIPDAAPLPEKMKEEHTMSTNEMDSKVRELRELRRMAAELADEISSIEDTIKADMASRGAEEAQGTDWRVTWKQITSERLDGKALKAELPDVAARYLKQTTALRFVLA